MSTVKENITNALTWFYDRLKTKHLDPIEESITTNEEAIEEVQDGVNELNSTKAPNSHASSGTTYGVGTTSNYGHCRTINNLTTSSHTNGYALSAYQGYVLNNNKSNLLVSQNVSVENITAAGGTNTTVSIDVSKSGYTPFGIVGWTLTNSSSSGTGSGSMFIVGISGLSGTSYSVRLRNVASSDAKVDVLVRVLYVKDS